MPENIHLVHFSSGPGGIEVLLPVMIKSMTGQTFSAFVIRPLHEVNSVYEDAPVSLEYGSDRNIVAFFKMLRYTTKYKKAVFHAFNIGPVFLLLLKLGGARRIIYSIHGTIYWKTNFEKLVYRFLWKIALSGKETLIANSEHSRSEFLKKIGHGVNVRVLYNPIESHRFIPREGNLHNEEILIIYSGRLEKGKNLERWIDIAAYLHARIPDSRFEIYGDGFLKGSLQQQIAALKADDYIQLKGFRKDIESAYRSADMLLFLSEYESFGNVVVESVLCGTPVLTLPIPVMKEIFCDYPQFVLNDNENLEKQVLFKVKQLDDLREKVKCARENFLKRFSVEKHIETLQNIYSGNE